jgi:hypothetical protein
MSGHGWRENCGPNRAASGAKKPRFSLPGGYQCAECPRVFQQSGHRRRHYAAVHEGQRLACDVCGNFFARRESLMAHMAAKHEPNRASLTSKNGVTDARRWLAQKRKRDEGAGTGASFTPATAYGGQLDPMPTVKIEGQRLDAGFIEWQTRQEARLRDEYRQEKAERIKALCKETSLNPITVDSDEESPNPSWLPEPELVNVDGKVTSTQTEEVKEIKSTIPSRDAGPPFTYRSPLARPEDVLPLTQQLQLARDREAGKNLALKAQTARLDAETKRGDQLQRELSLVSEKHDSFKAEAVYSLAKAKEENHALQEALEKANKKIEDLQQKVKEYAAAAREHYTVLAEYETAKAQVKLLESRIIRIQKKSTLTAGKADKRETTDADIDALLEIKGDECPDMNS